jgi:hypothetical protein
MKKTISIGDNKLQISTEPCELTKIGIKHQSDKAYWHKYTHAYSKLFKHLGFSRESEFTFLEIGFSHGSSHLMWREYFPNATIVAIDLHDWRWYQERERSLGPIPDRLKEVVSTNFDDLFDEKFQLYIGNQKDQELLKKVCDKYGPFDVILDDASHFDFETRVSFNYLFPHLKSGGPYIIEDLHGQHFSSVPEDIRQFNNLNKFSFLDHDTKVKSVSYIRMAYDLGLSKSLLPPYGNGASDMGIIIKK